MEVDELKTKLIELLGELAEGAREMIKSAPHMAVPLRNLVDVPKEELGLAIEKLATEAPLEVLEAFCSMLEDAKQDQEHTNWRLDRRVQDPEKTREKKPFQSFCKRKGDW